MGTLRHHGSVKGRALGTLTAAALVLGVVGTVVVAADGVAGAVPSGPQTLTVGYTGGPQYFQVPAGVTSVTFDLYGSQGAGNGGKGGEATVTQAVTPGDLYQINVGGQGGWNGGGSGGSSSGGAGGSNGGGATDLRLGGTAPANRVLVAGGGGGGTGVAGGAGGGSAGAGGSAATGSGFTIDGGGGGTQSNAGGGGNNAVCGYPSCVSGTGGSGPSGGAGASSTSGGGNAGGGGGGGYYGGGGGQATQFSNVGGGAGGGGSGYGPTATLTSGVQSGNGSAVITYNGPLGAVVTLGVSSATTLPGYAETYTASVAAPAGSTTPLGSGTITFNDNGTTLPGCANLSPVSGAATCSVTYGLTDGGGHTITATYTGDNVNYAGNSASQTVQVTIPSSPNPTTTTLSASQSTWAINTPLVLTATESVASGTLPLSLTIGTVAFTDGGTPVAGCGAVALNASNQATCSTSFTATGNHPITAQFSGDTHFTSSSASLAMYADTFQTAFASTGANQTFVVPGGTSQVTVEVQGAQGGAGCSSGALGGTAWTTVPATYNQTFTVAVGGAGGNNGGGYNGGGGGGASPGWPIYTCPTTGGGGGASDVRTGGAALADRVVVAGGGGGGSDAGGGVGGGTSGTGGGSNTYAGQGGGGASQTSGGGGGSGFWANGGSGSLGTGGGGGGTGNPGSGGGGGGGGYYGGGGGGADTSGGGGGGGSGFGPSGTVFTTGTHAGNGKVLIGYSPANVLTVTVSATQVYGGSPTYSATYGGFISGDGPSDLGGALSCSSVNPLLGVGSSALSGCGGLTSATYDIVYLPQSIAVSPAPLQATVTGTQPFGGTPVYSATYSGFVNGQGSSVVAGSLACSTSAGPTSPTGPGYSISACSGLSAANYAISYTYGTLTVVQAPSISSAGAATFTVGTAGSFTVTTGPRYPTAVTLTETGALPSGVTFVDSGNGTATLSGTPATGQGKAYVLTIRAHNGINPDALQTFALTVDEAPTITSAASTTFTAGTNGSFTVTTGHEFPSVPTLTESGALPAGVTFADKANGTATLSGTPAAGASGVFAITITATNGVVPDAVQQFTLTVRQGPAITSASSTSFVVGTAGTFTVTSPGTYPAPTITSAGTLPSGVSFTDNHNGTATLSGTPATGQGSVYTLSFTASNGVGTPAVQQFTLTVNEAVRITSPSTATFSVGTPGTFSIVSAFHFGAAATLTEVGPLPSGVTLTDGGGGTGTLAGTPAVGSGGNYPITLVASNGVSPAGIQQFVLTVQQPPAFTSAAATTLVVRNPGSFAVSVSGFPAPALSESGTLPAGVTFVDDGGGSATLSGTPGTGTAGAYPITLTASNGVGSPVNQSFTLNVALPAELPLWMATADGGVFPLGTASSVGSMAGRVLNAPIVGIAPTPSGLGYWLVASDGGIFAFGDANFYGSMGGTHLNAPIVGIAPTPSGLGYWLVASDGGIFAFGDANFYGSMGGTHLNQPVVGIAPAPSGLGYWLVASDGGIFAFGDANFYGSMGAQHLNQPIVGLAAAPGGDGYWMVARDGGIFNFGRAAFAGSAVGITGAAPAVGVAADLASGGYWVVTATGGIFAFDAPPVGSLTGGPIIGTSTSVVVGLSAGS